MAVHASERGELTFAPDLVTAFARNSKAGLPDVDLVIVESVNVVEVEKPSGLAPLARPAPARIRVESESYYPRGWRPLAQRSDEFYDYAAEEVLDLTVKSTPASADVLVVKPYWAVLGVGLASAAVTLLICLLVVGSATALTIAFLLAFGFGLGGSCLGLLISAPSTHRSSV